MSVKTIVTEVAALNLPDLQRVKLHVDALVSQRSVTPKLDNDWLTNGIITEMRRRGRLRDQNRHPDAWRPAGYAAKCTEMSNYLLTKSRRELTLSERVLLGTILARALADYLAVERRLTFKKMLEHIEDIPDAMEECFPGYLESGILDFLVRTQNYVAG